jgi:hypothetical protein
MVAALLLFIGSAADAAPLRILVVDAHDGRPIKDTDVSVAILGQRGAYSYKTDASGAITIDAEPTTKLISSTGWRVTCRKTNPMNPHWFLASTVIEQGVVDENTCGKARSEPIKGTLMIFTRRSTFFENMAR